MAAVTAVTALNTFNGGFITASRFIYGTAREGSLPPSLARLNDRAVPWVPVVVLGGVSTVVALVVALTHAWAVLVAVGAALEAMIYAVAGFCALRLRTRQPDSPRPFRVPGLSVLGPVGIVLFGVPRHRGVGLGAEPFRSRPARDHRDRRVAQRLLRAAGTARRQGEGGGPPGRPSQATPAPAGGATRLLSGRGAGQVSGGCAGPPGARGGPGPGRPAPRSRRRRRGPRPPRASGTWRWA